MGLRAFRRDPLGYLTDAGTRGPVVPLRFGRTRAWLVVEPELIEQVLVREHKRVVKTPQLLAHRRLLGNGLLTNEGESWLRQRRLAQPAFHRESVARYGELMVDRTRAMIDTWPDGGAVDLHDEMQRLTVAIAARSLFGSDLDAEAPGLGDALETVMLRFVQRRGAARLVPSFVPTPGRLRFERAARRLDDAVFRMIAARRRDPEASDDLLSLLMNARDEDGTGLDDTQLRDEMVTLFVGGFDTPALGLAWAWQLIGEQPEIERRLVNELDDALGDRVPHAGDMRALPFTNAVVKESLRLYPPAWLLARSVTEPIELDGQRIGRGEQLLLSPWVVHRDARWFPDPERFIPDRWLDGSTDSLHRFAWFPFGGGPRVCIGAGFATLEAVLVLATVARTHRLVVTGERPAAWPALTLRPAGGVPALVSRRGARPHVTADATAAGMRSTG